MGILKPLEWIDARIYLKHKTDSSILTLDLINASPYGDTGQAYYPILKAVNGLRVELGQYIPKAVRGSVVIANGRNSLGYERRFSDLFERYTIIDQPIYIYTCRTSHFDTSPAADFQLIWTTIVKDVRVAFPGGNSEPTVTLICESNTIPKRIVTKPIEPVSFPSAPQQSLNKILPLAIGSNVDVAAHLIGGTTLTPSFAYATTFSNEHPVGGIQKYFCQNKDRLYVEVASAASENTPVIGSAPATPIAGDINFSTSRERAKLFNSGAGYIVTAVRFHTYYTAAAPDGTMTFTVYDQDLSTGLPGNVLGSAIVDAAGYAGVGHHAVEAQFSNALILKPNTNYYLSHSLTDSTVPGITRAAHNTDGLTESLPFLLMAERQDRSWRNTANLHNPVYFELYATKMTDSVSSSYDVNGLGFASFSMAQRSVAGYSGVDLSVLQFVLKINGLKDDAGGTITGTANLLIEKPVHAIRLICQAWLTSFWDDLNNAVDATKFASTHKSYAIAGATNGETTASDLVEQICRASAGQVGLFNGTGTKLLFYKQWRTEGTIAATISNDDCAVRDISIADSSTIVNVLQMFYDRDLLNTNLVRTVADTRLRDFRQNLFKDVNSPDPWNHLTIESFNTFGRRQMANGTFQFIQASSTAEFVGEFILARYNEPHVLCTLELPYFEYQSLQLLDIVRLKLVELPAFFGTSPLAKQETYQGAPCEGYRGHYETRTKEYRAEIVGHQIDWNGNDLTRKILTCRLILNYPRDLT